MFSSLFVFPAYGTNTSKHYGLRKLSNTLFFFFYSGANPRAAAESERIKKCLSMVVHLRGRICALNADCLVVAPASGIHCLKYTWSVTQTYFEKQEVTKRRKIKCSTSSSSSSSASASSCERFVYLFGVYG